jgi:two-component system, chemotaxis family, sensor kinase Cph1
VLRLQLKNLEAAIQESGAVVEHVQLPVVMADSSQLVQVFQNLIGNAIKFRGSEPPLIRVSAEAPGKEWIFSVADNGIGIAAEHRENVFVIFRRLHTRAEYPGTESGSRSARRLSNNMAAASGSNPNPGHGCIFQFTLPIKDTPRSGGDRKDENHT